MVTVRCLITIVVHNSWPIFQLDVNNVFLYGDLCEEVYMVPLVGYSDPNSKHVCKLIKSLYGLKQTPRQWNEKLNQTLIECGFVQSKCDYSLYTKGTDSLFIALLVYVDDIVITGNDLNEINKFEDFLSSKFKIKDLGKLKYLLGIEVLENNNGLYMTQRKYCLELLSELGLLDSKPLQTPLEQNLVIQTVESEKDMPLTNIIVYQKLVGKLIYLTLTRPDISYVVHCLSQVMHNPLNSHLQLAIRVLRYLKLSPGKGVSITKSNELKLRGYVDADWGKCLGSRRYVTEYCMFLGNSLVSWKSKSK